MYGFHFIAHSVGNPNRKAHVERAFHYVEHNFLAGRSFRDWNDLNQQARSWCEQVANTKVKRSLGMSPEAAYAMEKPHMLRLPAATPPIYQSEERIVDVGGFINLDTNRYSVPERLIGKQVMVHKHLLRVLVYFGQQEVADHERIIGQRGKTRTDKSHHKPLHQQQRRTTACEEEKLLRGVNNTLDRYIDGVKKRAPGRGVTRLRKLLHLQRTYPSSPFMAAVTQALEYGMYDLTRLEQMILDSTAGQLETSFSWMVTNSAYQGDRAAACAAVARDGAGVGGRARPCATGGERHQRDALSSADGGVSLSGREKHGLSPQAGKNPVELDDGVFSL